MSAQPQQPDTVFKQLVQHLVDLEEDKNRFMEEYVFRSSRERDELLSSINDYLSKLENFIRSDHLSDCKDGSFPFVIMGAKIEAQDMDTNDKISLIVKNPLRDDIGFDDVSCLSPVGKAMLLKEPGEVIAISTPGGIINYKIKNIQLHL